MPGATAVDPRGANGWRGGENRRSFDPHDFRALVVALHLQVPGVADHARCDLYLRTGELDAGERRGIGLLPDLAVCERIAAGFAEAAEFTDDRAGDRFTRTKIEEP